MRKLTESEYATLERDGEITVMDGSFLVKVVKVTDSPHYARADCVVGEKEFKFICWVTAPVNIAKRGNINISQILALHGFDKAFCFICGRMENELGVREVLTIDHIQELRDNGKDGVANTQILCSACHRMKNWLRTYLTFHLHRSKDRIIVVEPER